MSKCVADALDLFKRAAAAKDAAEHVRCLNTAAAQTRDMAGQLEPAQRDALENAWKLADQAGRALPELRARRTAAEVVRLFRAAALTADPERHADAFANAISLVVEQPGTITAAERDAIREAGRAALNRTPPELSDCMSMDSVGAVSNCVTDWWTPTHHRTGEDQRENARDLARLLQFRLSAAARLASIERRKEMAKARPSRAPQLDTYH